MRTPIHVTPLTKTFFDGHMGECLAESLRDERGGTPCSLMRPAGSERRADMHPLPNCTRIQKRESTSPKPGPAPAGAQVAWEAFGPK